MTEQHPLFKKLNLKAGMTVQILNAPQSFNPVVELLTADKVQTTLDRTQQSQFYLVFVQNQHEVAGLFEGLIQQPELDPLLWFAYPKKTSKLYQGDLHRDTGWQLLGQAGFEAVRQVAIDEDWSVLRFRHLQHIKQLTRDPKRRLTSPIA